MKKTSLFIMLLISIAVCLGQIPVDPAFPSKWNDAILKDENLNEKESISKLQQMDLSFLLVCNEADPPIGYIGNNYEKFDIFFNSIKKVPTKTNQYYVVGKTRVKQNVCDFQGAIILTNARYYIHKSEFGNYPDSVQVGLITGTYLFEEDPTKPTAGKLQGFLAIRYYIDPADKIHLDVGHTSCDTYYNQQYVGSWMTYDGQNIKPCNWGSYRVPACGDLDVGKNEFTPGDKYKANGWESYPGVPNTIWWK